MSNYRGRVPSPPPPDAPANLEDEYTIGLIAVGGIAFLSVVCCVAVAIAYKRGSSLSMKNKSKLSAPACRGRKAGRGRPKHV